MSIAVVLLASSGRVMHANPAAEALLEAAPRPLCRDGRLSADAATDQAALAQALQACARYPFDPELSLSVRLSGVSGSGIVARLVPAPRTMPAGVAAMAFLAREGQPAQSPDRPLRSLYQLTPAEAALVLHLIDGGSVESFAAGRRVSLSTAKTQLRIVFEKTGTRRQSDLMRLVMSIAR